MSQRPWSQSDYKVAYVLIASRIYWKVKNEDGTNKPQSFDDFRNAESFELVRLEKGTWDDVGECVKVDDYDGRTRITVCRRPRGQVRRRNTVFGRDILLQVLPSTHEQQEVWVSQIRTRIAPWSLLQ